MRNAGLTSKELRVWISTEPAESKENLWQSWTKSSIQTARALTGREDCEVSFPNLFIHSIPYIWMITLSDGTPKRMDEKEEERIKSLAKSVDSGEGITLAEIVDSDIIPSILKKRPLSYIEGFSAKDVAFPINCLLFDRIILEICPYCNCVQNPELIRPYLEREMVLPILMSRYQLYEAEFLDLIVQYPYIGGYTFNFLRSVYARASGEAKKGLLCPHCYKEACERILHKLSEIDANRKTVENLTRELKHFVLPSLYPTCNREFHILEQIEDVVAQKRIELLNPLGNEAGILYHLRNAQMFDAIPEVAQEDLSNIRAILTKVGLPSDLSIFEQIEERHQTIKALEIDYNPKMSIEEYLDIIHPRRERINRLISELVSGEEKDQRLKILKDEIWRINEEISSSKAIELLTFLTRFVSDNAQILFGMLVGGVIGYASASFAGCGLGSIGGLMSGAVGKHVSKHAPFKVPRYPKKTIEWIKTKIEGPEERLLAIALAKDIKTIQTWGLRRKLQK